MKRYHVLEVGGLLVWILLITGINSCASIATTQNGGKIQIGTNPTGATVYASGKKVGVTPLAFSADIFPTRRVGFVYRQVGTLSVEKLGCKSYTEKVDDALLSKDINIDLECGPQYLQSSEVPVKVETSPNGDIVNEPAESVESRLRRLNTLQENHLITDDEYRAIRRRILNSL